MSKYLNIIKHDCGDRFDAGETAAFSRELEYVHAEVIRAEYPELKFRNVCPIKSGGIPLGATSHRWFEIDGFGEAKFLDNLATEDFPTQEVKGDEQLGKIRSFGAKYMVTVEELRAAALMKVKPDTEKGLLTRQSMETLLDKTVFGSRTQTYGGFKGLIHDTMSTAWTGTPGNWFDSVNPAHVNFAPMRIISDIRGMVDEAFLATKGLFQKFDLFLPPEIGVLLDTPMAVIVNGTAQYLANDSVASYALRTIARLRSLSVDNFRLSAAGATGKHRGLCYPNDPKVFDVFIPLDFEQFAPEFSAMTFVTHCHGKYAGIRQKHPVAMRRVDLATAGT